MRGAERLLDEFTFGTSRLVWHPARAIVPVAMVSFAGVERQTSTDYVHHGLQRVDTNRAAFQYTLGGEGRLRYEGQEHRIEPGQAMLLHFPHDHCYWLPGGSWDFFYLTFNGEEIRRLWQHLVGLTGPVVSLPPTCAAVEMAAEVCGKALRGDIASCYESSALAFSFAMKLVEAVTPPSATLQDDGGGPDFIQRVQDFCLRHLGRPIGVDDMAKVAKMSRYHFTRQFRQLVGISPGKYLTNLRLDEARRLLRQQNLSVKQIAQRCGFADTRYFSRVFRTRYGARPSDLRKLQGAEAQTSQ